MDLLLALVLAAVGLTLLASGADQLVTGASDLSVRIGLSPLVTGVMVVGLATSAPEIILSVQAALAGESGIAYANIIGSNIANVWLIAGAGAVIFPLAVRVPGLRFSVVILILVSLVWSAVTGFARLNPAWGVFFLVVLAVYLITICSAVRPPAAETDARRSGVVRLAISLAFAIAALPAGAYLLILGATRISELIGIGSDVLGLTLVAIGTSLPELAATIASVVHRRTDLVVGNIIGSNLFNILGAGGAVALVGGPALSERLAGHGNPVMLAATFTIAPLILIGIRIGRGVGATFLVLYAMCMMFLAGGPW